MELGNIQKHSPILDAIREVETETTAEIQVHISQSWIEKDPYLRAEKLFQRYELFRTRERNGILIYVNLRKRKFAILVDSGFHQHTGQLFWEQKSQELSENLRSTHSEKAIAMIILSLKAPLKKTYPVES